MFRCVAAQGGDQSAMMESRHGAATLPREKGRSAGRQPDSHSALSRINQRI
jgi:hypothetical protein